MGRIKPKILSKGDQLLDTYDIQTFIGEGAFGEVYKVRHKYLGIQVLKVFRKEYSDNTDLETVMSEAKILSRLTHPNIVRVFETNTFRKNDQQMFFITMGFIAGETLTQLLRRKIQLPIAEAMSIQRDLLAGLRLAHEQDPPIIHRDISPDNILISYDTRKPRALLSDFGLAQSFDQISSISNAAGKYPYMAPECFWGAHLLASDVFSAGIVFYRMLTGMMPWEYDFENTVDTDGIMTMIIIARKQTPRKPSLYCDACDDRLDRVVLKALSTDIENRYRNAGEFLEELEESLIMKKVEKDMNLQS